MTALLSLRDVDAHHGDLQALFGVSLEVHEGEIVAIVGANAAGKSTTINVISGLVRATTGQVELEGTRIDRLPAHQIVERGVVQIPEGRQLFPYMTVEQNLEMGAYTPAARAQRQETLEEVFALLPVLRDRRAQLAVSLSGGEQQMCAIARGLMARPRVLMLDEPSLGLAPKLVEGLYDLLAELRDESVTILLVDQAAVMALSVADRAYVLQSGRIVHSGAADALRDDPGLAEAYLGSHER
jgi:branched-chain amino acid transport system ATP-binding protein